MTATPQPFVYPPREGLIPTAARDPWTTFGSLSSAVGSDSSSWWLDITTAGLGFYRRTVTMDVSDDMEIQALAVRTSGSGAFGIAIGDGAALLGLSIGNSLSLFGGSYSRTIVASWDASVPHSYKLRKDGTRRWVVLVDDREIIAIPYTETAAVTDAARLYFGGLGTCVSRWYLVEAGVNDSVPAQWKVDKMRDTSPPAMAAHYTDTPLPDAINRTILGWFATSDKAMTDYIDARTSGQMVIEQYEGDGSALPGVGNTLSELSGGLGPALSVVRQRIRFPVTTTTGRAIGHAWADPPAWGNAHVMVRAKITARSFPILPNGFCGPYLAVAEESVIYARLIYSSSTKAFTWRLSSGSADYDVAGEVVDPYQDHTVELHLFVGYGALLIVDGFPRGFVLWADLDANLTHVAAVGTSGSGSRTCEIDVEDIRVTRSSHDLGRRPVLEQRALEANVPIGGWDRNDELETVVRAWYGVHEQRGTHDGIVLELQRLTHGLVSWFDDVAPRSWYLNRSWPGVTPIYLNSPNVNTTRTYTIGTSCKLLTPLRLAQWAAYNLLPRSIGTRQFQIALRVDTTSAFSAGVASIASDPKVPLSISVNDLVTLRSPSGTVPVVRRVTAVSATSITLSPAPSGTLYTTGSIVLLTLARS